MGLARRRPRIARQGRRPARDRARITGRHRRAGPWVTWIAEGRLAGGRLSGSRWRTGRRRRGHHARITTYITPDDLRSEKLDRQAERAHVGGSERPHTDHLPGDFLAALIANREDDRVFPGSTIRGMADGAFHPQRRRRGQHALRRGIEPQVMQAARTHGRTFKDGGLAVRTAARLARVHLNGGSWNQETAASTFAVASVLTVELPFSPQPNSTWPRMREPAATVREPAFTSPTTMPVS